MTWIRARAWGRPKALLVKSIPGRIELDTNSIPTSELALALALAPTESIDTSGPWYDVEGRRYIEDTTSERRSHEQHSVLSAPAQAQPLQDQTNQ